MDHAFFLFPYYILLYHWLGLTWLKEGLEKCPRYFHREVNNYVVKKEVYRSGLGGGKKNKCSKIAPDCNNRWKIYNILM